MDKGVIPLNTAAASLGDAVGSKPKAKCKTCENAAHPVFKPYCNECQAIGAFFQYEQNHLWSTLDTEEEFLSKLNSWKSRLTEEERKFIINDYWNQ